MTRFLSIILLSVLGAGIASAASSAPANLDSIPTPVKVRLGFDLGWESPYTAGMELAVTIKEVIDLNAGVGLGLSGFKAGVGARIYPMQRYKWTPMVGAYLFTSSGWGEVTINSEGDEAYYDIPSAKAYSIQLGLRCRMKGDDYFLVSAGRTWAYDGGKAIYLSGTTNEVIKKSADIMGVGGFSFNLGYLMRLGKKR